MGFMLDLFNDKELNELMAYNNAMSYRCTKNILDASYALHDDGKGRTRNVVTLGKGTFKISSTKHHIVTKNSTEAFLTLWVAT